VVKAHFCNTSFLAYFAYFCIFGLKNMLRFWAVIADLYGNSRENRKIVFGWPKHLKEKPLTRRLHWWAGWWVAGG